LVRYERIGTSYNIASAYTDRAFFYKWHQQNNRVDTSINDHIPTLHRVGHGLTRPECVLAHSSGLLFTSNCADSGGISVICNSGETHSLLGNSPQNPIKPNGIALESDGHFLLAHLGDSDGGIYRLTPNGAIAGVVTHANGYPLPPTNFVTVDAIGRIWITVSTTVAPRANDYRKNACTGFIAVAEQGQYNARIVVNDLAYANECVVDMNNNYVYVNETFGRRLLRFDLATDGSLSNRHILTTFNVGTYPDGLTLVDDGSLIITSIVSNRVIKVSPNGEQELILEDADIAFVEAAESAYRSDSLGSKHLASTGETSLANISSLAFGGYDRTTAYIGNLLGSCLYSFETDMHGVAPSHWTARLGYLEQFVE